MATVWDDSASGSNSVENIRYNEYQKTITEKKRTLAEVMEEEKAQRDNFMSNYWYYRDPKGIPRGPCTVSSLKICHVNGFVTRKSMVFGDGMNEWLPLESVPHIGRTILYSPDTFIMRAVNSVKVKLLGEKPEMVPTVERIRKSKKSTS